MQGNAGGQCPRWRACRWQWQHGIVEKVLLPQLLVESSVARNVNAASSVGSQMAPSSCSLAPCPTPFRPNQRVSETARPLRAGWELPLPPHVPPKTTLGEETPKSGHENRDLSEILPASVFPSSAPRSPVPDPWSPVPGPWSPFSSPLRRRFALGRPKHEMRNPRFAEILPASVSPSPGPTVPPSPVSRSSPS